MADPTNLLDPEGNNQEGSTFKIMLLIQIKRLSTSTDPLDRQLRNYLISIVKDKGYQQKSWITEIEEMEQIHKLIKSGKSVGSAVDIVEKKSKSPGSKLQDKYAEYKVALTEIDQIFQESLPDDSG